MWTIESEEGILHRARVKTKSLVRLLDSILSSIHNIQTRKPDQETKLKCTQHSNKKWRFSTMRLSICCTFLEYSTLGYFRDNHCKFEVELNNIPELLLYVQSVLCKRADMMVCPVSLECIQLQSLQHQQPSERPAQDPRSIHLENNQMLLE